MINILLILKSLIWFLFTVIFFKFLWKRRHLYMLSMKMQGPFSVPIVGSIFLLYGIVTNKEPVQVLHDAYKKYKGMFRAWLGPDLYIVIVDPEDVESVMTHTLDAKPTKSSNALEYGMGLGLLAMTNINGSSSFKVHKKIISQSLNLNVIKKYFPCIRNIYKDYNQELDALCNKGLVDVAVVMYRAVSEATLASIFELKLDFKSGDRDKYFKLVDNILECTYNTMKNICYTIHPIYTMSSDYKRIRKSHKLLNEIVNEIYDKKMEEYLNNEKPFNESTVDVLIKSKMDGLLSDREIKDEMMTVFASSVSSIGSQLQYTILMLAIHKECQDKVVQEIDSYFKYNDNVELEDLDKFPYLDMCLKEVLRLFPTGPLTARYCTKDFELKSKKLMIPAGTNVAMVGYLTMRDPDIWKDPSTYNPNRFLPEESEKRHPNSYFPYSGGPRMCVGIQYSKVMAKLYMINFLKHYKVHSDWKLQDMPISLTLNCISDWGYDVQISRRD